MTVFPTRKPLIAASDNTALVPAQREPGRDAFAPPRFTPAEWARRRRADREARRVEAAGHRALARIEHLGSAWHVVNLPRAEMSLSQWEDTEAPRRERAGFLAIGPGGVFAVTVLDHGRSRVLIAGDVVQINGRRPPYIAEARREARQATKALSRAVGRDLPVVPVLTLVGSGVISMYGLPKDCLVAPYQDLDRLLIAGGARISAHTAQKLTDVARHPATWMNGPYQSAAERYRWYGADDSASDKTAARR